MKNFLNAWRVELVLLFLLLGALAVMSLVGCGAVRPATTVAHHFFQTDSGESSLLLWLVSISILGIGGCIAAAIFLPVKQLAVSGIAGFASVLGLALVVKAALPFLPYVALAFAVLAVAAGIMLFRRYVMGLHAAVLFGTSMSKAETDAQAELLKIQHAAFQEQIGVKGIIDTALNQPFEVPPLATKPPA
jgi:glucan phosphoethanolaminetransferase (alkaline phosphatase superfamily)